MKAFAILILILVSPVITAQENTSMKKKVNKTDEEWKEVLSAQEY